MFMLLEVPLKCSIFSFIAIKKKKIYSLWILEHCNKNVCQYSKIYVLQNWIKKGKRHLKNVFVENVWIKLQTRIKSRFTHTNFMFNFPFLFVQFFRLTEKNACVCVCVCLEEFHSKWMFLLVADFVIRMHFRHMHIIT